MTTEQPQIDDGDLFGAKVDIDDGTFGSQYPIITWINGMPARKQAGGLGYTGGFFIDNEQGIDVPGAEPYEHVTSNGDVIEGKAIRDLTFSVIRMRRCLRVDEGEGESSFTRQYSMDEWDDAASIGKPRGVTHVLARVKGMDENVVLVFTGQSGVAMAAGGKKRGVIPDFRSKIVDRARHEATKAGHDIKYPTCSFLLTVGPMGERGKKGFEPEFTEVGKKDKSKITLPMWVDRPEGAATLDAIRKLFVGNTKLNELQSAYKDSESWYNAWSTEELQKKRGVTPSAPTNGVGDSAGSVPDSDDIPF